MADWPPTSLRGDRVVTTFLPDPEPERSKTARAIAAALMTARSGANAPRGMLIEEVDGSPASLHSAGAVSVEAGFVSGAMGMQPTPAPVGGRPSVEGRESTVTKLPATPPGSRRNRRPFRSTVSSPLASRHCKDDSETDSTDD